ncbi:hypothetical protein OE88DRAFT_346058 [Heliocybe sulcata]|uniref:Uncharacterized protein n=1 Tax=Heliocybe sulcata TaxID=5364 RepID=A0A5C3N0C4_9AGAM|nr:hypothetical protein OE88DRAFT_346058 [Heliocybe sulcata]
MGQFPRVRSIFGELRCRSPWSMVRSPPFRSSNAFWPNNPCSLTAMVFDLILLILVVLKTADHVKSHRQRGVPMNWGLGGRMLCIMARDSVLYYVAVFAAYLMGLLSWSRRNHSTLDGDIPLGYHGAFHGCDPNGP